MNGNGNGNGNGNENGTGTGIGTGNGPDSARELQRETDDRYQYVELDVEPDPIHVIHDTENLTAWLQSTVSMAVER